MQVHVVTVKFTAQRNCRILIFGEKLAGFVFLGEGSLLLSNGVLMWDQFRHEGGSTFFKRDPHIVLWTKVSIHVQLL